MSQGNAKEVLKLLAGLERLARLASTVPPELLAAWLVFDAGLSKTQARNVAESIRRLLKLLEKEGEKQ